MFIDAVGTAVPAARYTQRECWEALRGTPQFAALRGPSRLLLERVLTGEQGVRSRHLALEGLAEAFAIDPDVLAGRYARHAPELATRAAHRALAKAGLAAQDIDALVVSTCTGYLCPGLSSYVAERLELRADALGLDLVGQGCGAALPNLRTAEALLAAGRAEHVLCICVEVCSAALYIDDDPGVLVSGCLFGDGAAAAVASRAPCAGSARVEWIDAVSLVDPGERESLRMETRGGLLRNLLSREVPQIAAEHAAALLHGTLERHGLAREEIREWIWHAGGRSVLERLRAATGLEERHTRRSADVLARFGNLSSPFVLFVLAQTLEERGAPGWWWMSSFGAGFSCHGALLRVA
ncbi:MAG TPA: 3-oxoacyl-[acyl-carrier-protein] synthase III C-terminal domain-containing protein [Burkholderiales bacterium]|jgi:alkylresorcinol/alkylpyrone synthase|nr:3-oxoacyl-[acyl-carrier-protein] synthase III C-terminal domain-containing protein [Burkholderiales bacterium]